MGISQTRVVIVQKTARKQKWNTQGKTLQNSVMPIAYNIKTL